MSEKFKIGFIGYGRRGKGFLKTVASLPDVEVAAVCDLIEERRQKAAAAVLEIAGNTPKTVTDYRDLFDMKLNAVINCASWADHTQGLPMITDVYDAATMMAITPLSEESIAKGGAPVMMPDFTKGRYLTRKPLTSDDNPWSAIN